MTIGQNHSALVYFFGVSGSTTLGSIKIGASGQTTTMLRISGGGISQLTSGVAVAFDQPLGTAPKVSYAPASSSVWSSAGVVLESEPVTMRERASGPSAHNHYLATRRVRSSLRHSHRGVACLR